MSSEPPAMLLTAATASPASPAGPAAPAIEPAAHPTRRGLLVRGAAFALGAGPWALAVRPVQADEVAMMSAVALFAGGRLVRPGKVRLTLPELVDNGNAVAMSVSVDSPMSAADHVQAIAVFNERNPYREVARFSLGPRAGRAEVSTRIRLATSQRLIAVARLSDGSHWSHTVEVVVTLAACIEG